MPTEKTAPKTRPATIILTGFLAQNVPHRRKTISSDVSIHNPPLCKTVPLCFPSREELSFCFWSLLHLFSVFAVLFRLKNIETIIKLRNKTQNAMKVMSMAKNQQSIPCTVHGLLGGGGGGRGAHVA